MGPKILVLLPSIYIQCLITAARTEDKDFAVLNSLQDIWDNIPPGWVGSDPCGANWEGIWCNNSRVTSIILTSMGLTGTLSTDVTTLLELQTLDLSYNKGLRGPLPSSIGNLKNLTNLILVGCSFSGEIPDSIGSLQQLIFLRLNSNSFSGQNPPSIGQLSNLYWLDLADNQLTGPIPVSNGNSSGLNKLVRAKHFHVKNNQLSGTIPDPLFSSNMGLIHVLFENNKLIGMLPSSLGLERTLRVVRFDRNILTGPVPSNLKNLKSVTTLFLSNNNLTGPMPNLSGMNLLSYLDLSNNTFEASEFPSSLSTLQSLMTLMMENTQIQGRVPSDLFSLPHLQSVVLKRNRLNGTLDIGILYSNQLQSIDLQENFISDFIERGALDNVDFILGGNPMCLSSLNHRCTVSGLNSNYSTALKNCQPIPCNSDQISSPSCKCAYPYTGTLFFRAPSFSYLGNSSYYVMLEASMLQFFRSHQLPVDSVALHNPRKNSIQYLELSLQIFPSNEERFNRAGVSRIGFALSNQTYKPAAIFGPYFFIADPYQNFSVRPKGQNKSTSGSSKRSIGVIIGAAAGGFVLLILLLLAAAYACFRKRRAQKANQQNPLAHLKLMKSSDRIPELKGARRFSLEEISKYTNNFSEANSIGSGGYVKVYRGTLPTGQLIAIKQAKQGSTQGAIEFKTEIELLSRVHHRNVVSLLGFCLEQDEKILVYEYITNGSLKDSLSGKSGIRLDWITRLKIALGAARGLAYLHELANPPIIHRDVKSTNILLDERLNAKVADFGISKPMDDTGKTHVTTQIKGTLGYLDPKYYITQKLNEKSDVYSFGVLMLELLTGRGPIHQENHIASDIKEAMDKEKNLYKLSEFLDPAIWVDATLIGFEKFVDLAMRCVEESRADRPKMSYLVKKIEKILQLAGPNSNADKHLLHDEEYSNEISITLPR